MGNMNQQMPIVIHLGRQEWQVALRRPFRDPAVRIKGGAMAIAKKRAVLRRREFAFLVGAYGRQGKQLALSPDHEKSQSDEPVVDPLAGIVGKRSGIHHSLRDWRCSQGMAIAERAGGTQQS